MKKIVIIFLMLILLLLSACNKMEPLDVEGVIAGYEQLRNRTEEEILILDKKYSIENLKHIEKGVEPDYYRDYNTYLHCLTGYNVIITIYLSGRDPLEEGLYILDVEDVNKKRTLENYNEKAPILCIRRIYNDLLYTVHCIRGIYVYGFFEYDEQIKKWISTGEIYEANTLLEKKDFDEIKIGSSFMDVLKIDSSQEVAFYFKRVCNEEFKSHHILNDGFLTITYEGKVDNTTQRQDLRVKSMKWSAPLPILKQDLPK